ncbi:MAG: class I SAM-dependent methyltransferase [Methylococcales bacterium]|nr:class I SAM-dependent methyltransferase [Methylococcaceae bacterium]
MIARSKLSSVDDVGAVYIDETRVIRAISPSFEDFTHKLLNSGLIEQLVGLDLFPKTWVSDLKFEGCNVVLEHEKAEVTTYPYEWSPEMLRRAALCTLKVAEIAVEFGYQLKDAQPYNVIFSNKGPIFVDFGSFVEVNDAKGWLASHEFYSSFYLPLKLYEIGLRESFGKLFIKNGFGVSAHEYLRIKYPILGLIGIDNLQRLIKGWNFLRRIAIDPQFKTNRLSPKMHSTLTGLARFVFRGNDYQRLTKSINRIQLHAKSQWGDYHQESGLINESGEVSLSDRFKTVLDILKEARPQTVLELACNQGVLANEISQLDFVKRVVCTDYDEIAIDKLVKRFSDKNTKLAPAILDFVKPLGNLRTDSPVERYRSDLVIALAVTHHLILTQKISIKVILDSLFSYSKAYVLVEFMPLGLWNGHTTLPMPSWYTPEWFEEHLKNYASIEKRIHYSTNRILYFCKKTA